MPPDELKARARRIPEEMLTQGDLAVADEVIAPDCLHHAPHAVAPGSYGLKAWVGALRRAFPDLRAIVDDEIVEGDKVVQRLVVSGTYRDPLMGAPSTGRRVSWQQVEILRAGPDGRFTERWSYEDRPGLLRHVQTGEDDA
ncbi:MAG TPA: ester cyclase [Thermomicrobiales bacterium]|nr:ester cyclase [Thermomicrobiales bacterium]